MGMIKEFKEFAMKGSVIDLAVGVIIGGAFGKIVSSLIEDIIMPVIGTVTGGVDFSNKFTPLSDNITSKVLVEARKQGPVLAYGNFITVFINFLLMAFAIFIMVKIMNRARELAKINDAKAPPEPPADVKLLTEIRDLLKQQKA
jgi:large conductance mechanosensitive channel